ncbi:MAG: ribosome recycling factor [Synergistes sp.]|nr:ribosome recycling factor [Synergistes sp.]
MPQNVIKELSSRCEKSIEHLKSTMLGIRTGRAHPALVEEIKVDYFGTPTPIKNMGSVTVPEARQIVVTPWDKSAMKSIEKAILASSLGITPQNDGESIRLNMPELTQQRRVELKKMVNKMAEDGRVAVRNIRRDAIETLKKMEKESKITEDDLKKYQKEAQDKTDAFIKKIDGVLADKEKEIMDK